MIPDLVLKLTIDGTEQTLRYRSIPLFWWEQLKQATGLTPTSLWDGIVDTDVSAIVALLWLVNRHEDSKLTYRKQMQHTSPDVSIEVEHAWLDGECMLDGTAEHDADGCQAGETAEAADVPPTTSAAN